MRELQDRSRGTGTRPYAGVRILDMTYHFGAYAGRLFADLGAEVIRVEPPGGLPDRVAAERDGPAAEARFLFLNASKKSIVLDLDSEEDLATFNGLASHAAIVFVERGGPMYERIGHLRSVAPQAVVTAISPFGLTGPMADAPASDLIVQSAGGIAWLSGRIEEAPLSLPFDQATMVASVYAAAVTAIALADAETRGNGHLIDVSAQECIAHSLQNALQVWDLEQRISIRGGEGTRDATEDIFPCRDGFIFLAAPLALGASFSSLVQYMKDMGHPSGDRLSEPCWQDREWRLTRQAREAFREIFVDFTQHHDRETLTQAAIERRIVMSPVNRISDLFHDPQLAHRAFFRTLTLADGQTITFPGAPYNVSPPIWDVAPPAPLGSWGKNHEATIP